MGRDESNITAAALADLHHRGMQDTRAWTAPEFGGMLAQPGVILCTMPNDSEAPNAFALGRVVADEAELLTIVSDPARRRQGLARAVLTAFCNAAAVSGATTAFLEVSTENAAAISLYLTEGWREAGRRRAYYTLRDGRKTDALVMSRAF